MADIQRVGDLEIVQDLKHQRREWIVERVGWVIMGVLALAALSGLMGGGSLSDAVAGSAGSSLWAEYRRFDRYQAPTILRIQVMPKPDANGEVRLRLNRQFIDNIELRHIDPEPDRVETDADSMTYTFLMSAADRPAAVTYHFEANAFGRLPITVTADSGTTLEFSPFIYP